MKKSKLFLMLLALVAFGQTAWAQYSGGTGTEESPYLIQTANDWRGLARDIYLWRTYNDAHFKLTNDIELSETVEHEPSTMLGVTENASFQGTLDGDGHTLTVDYIDNSKYHYCGPFRYIKGATIKNLHVTGRVVVCTDVARNVSTQGMTPGVYVLRLINGDNVKTQKIVIE